MTSQPIGRLQLIASPSRSGRDLRDVVRAAIAGGVDLVQLRVKECTTATRIALARELLGVTEPGGIPLLVNDDVEAVRQLGDAVAGVHLGQGDLPVDEARRLLGPERWIGLSTHSAAEVARAEAGSATHLGIGACFATSTKVDPRILAHEELTRACRRATRPLFAIGGITAENVATLVGLGVRRVAVSHAILAAADPAAAAAAFRAILDREV